MQSIKRSRFWYYLTNLKNLSSSLSPLCQNYQELDKCHRKTTSELIRMSACVCGIELCYAAETAFVNPVLLRLGVPVTYVTLVWCLSPLFGFFLVPLLGSLSDRCELRLGRRRPFIVILSVGIVLGLLLISNARNIGIFLGDANISRNSTLKESLELAMIIPGSNNSECNSSSPNNRTFANCHQVESVTEGPSSALSTHAYGIAILIIGLVILDFSCDACQSPSRAYLVDASIPADHPRGLTMFTIMAGLGGSVGYLCGAVDWFGNDSGFSFSRHLQVLFTLISIVYLILVTVTLTSFKEIPLEKQNSDQEISLFVSNDKSIQSNDNGKENSSIKEQLTDRCYNCGIDINDETSNDRNTTSTSNVSGIYRPQEQNYFQTGDRLCDSGCKVYKPSYNYGSSTINPEKGKSLPQFPRTKQHTQMSMNNKITVINKNIENPSTFEKLDCVEVSTSATVKVYLLSIVHMPISLFTICLTNLFCWMSLLCYSLYFTDFVGEYIYRGNPRAARFSLNHTSYQRGVRMGSLGMSLYSFTCSIYSLVVERLIHKFGIKIVYIGGQLAYTSGALLMLTNRSLVSALVLSCSSGVMYATLFTMPYIVVAKYHSTNQFSKGAKSGSAQLRGLGTDVAVVSSMVFLAQFILSLSMGHVISAIGSMIALPIMAAILSFLGAISASQIVYMDS